MLWREQFFRKFVVGALSCLSILQACQTPNSNIINLDNKNQSFNVKNIPCYRWQVRSFNNDNSQSVSVNGTQVFYVDGYGKPYYPYVDSGLIDINHLLKPGENTVDFLTVNFHDNSPHSWGYEVYKDGQVIFNDIGRIETSPDGAIHTAQFNIHVDSSLDVCIIPTPSPTSTPTSTPTPTATPTINPTPTPYPTSTPPILTDGCSCEAPITGFSVKGKPCNTPCVVSILPTGCRSKVPDGNGGFKDGSFTLGALYDIDKKGPDLTAVIYPTPIKDSSGKRIPYPNLGNPNYINQYQSKIEANNTSAPNISGNLINFGNAGSGNLGNVNDSWENRFTNDTATTSIGVVGNINKAISDFAKTSSIASKIVQDYRDKGYPVPIPPDNRNYNALYAIALNLSQKAGQPVTPNVTDAMSSGDKTEISIRVNQELIKLNLKMLSKTTTNKQGVTYSSVKWEASCGQ